MKVLLSTLSLSAESGGGTTQRTVMLARHLKAAGAQCRVIAIERGVCRNELIEIGIAAEATGHLRIPYHLPLINLFKLARWVREADAIHILGYWNLLSICVAGLAGLRGKPYYLSVAGELSGQIRNPVKVAFHRLLGRRMLNRARAIIAVTELEMGELIERHGVEHDRIFVLPNGVEPPTPLAHSAPKVARPYILYMGRLASVKGPDLLIEAFNKIAESYSDVDLVMAGPDFGMRRSLVARCQELGISNRIHFPGFLEPGAKRLYYEGALFLVVPSRDEAMSLVALEAGALGRPVLLTDRCGFDAVAAVGGGAVVAASVEGIAAGLASMLGQRGNLDAMGLTLRKHVLSNYSWPQLAQNLLDRFNDLPTPGSTKGASDRSVSDS